MDQPVGFLGLLGQTIVLGLAAAFTPSLLTMQILVVAGDPWRRRALAVALGASAAFVPVGLLMLFGFAQLPTASDVADPVGAWLRIVAGIALAVTAVVLLRPHPALQRRVDSDVQGYMRRASPWFFFGIAFALSIKDVSSYLVMAPALHDIAVADINVVEQVLLLVLLFVLALSPVLLPPVLRLAFGHRVDAALKRVYAFTVAHQFQLVGAMAAAIAAYLVVSGVARL